MCGAKIEGGVGDSKPHLRELAGTVTAKYAAVTGWICSKTAANQLVNFSRLAVAMLVVMLRAQRLQSHCSYLCHLTPMFDKAVS